MAGKGVKSGPSAEAPARPDPSEEASRLKSLAAAEYDSGNLKAAVKHVKRAQKLCPTLDGLPGMLAAFKIIRTAAAPIAEGGGEGGEGSTIIDYYAILGVEQFSRINAIKKQFKKLAMMLHPDKNPMTAATAAFKLVAEAAGVLSDKIRRKEYDTRLRVAIQSKATAAGLAESETFWTACSTCRLLHQFERKYLGHSLLCPECKKLFKAMEVAEDNTKNDGGSAEMVQEQEQPIGASAEIFQEQKQEQPISASDGIVQEHQQQKRPIRTSDEIVKEQPQQQQQIRASARIKEMVERGDGLGIVMKCGLGLKMKRNRKDPAKSIPSVEEVPPVTILVEEDDQNGPVEGAPARTTLVNEDDVPARKTPVEEDDSLLPKRITDVKSLGGYEDPEEETMTLSQIWMLVKKNKRTVEVNVEEGSKKRDMVVKKKRKTVEASVKEGSKKRDREDAKENGVESAKEIEVDVNGRGKPKLIRRRLPEYLDSTPYQTYATKKKGHSKTGKTDEWVELVADGDFHDFDMHKTARSFKKGQMWAIYNDYDGMPYRYLLINEVVSTNPFEVETIWLRSLNFSVCGSFQVSNSSLSIKSRDLFSHIVDCSQAAEDKYRVYPKKNSVWALKFDNGKTKYEIVLCLNTYSESHGLSITRLEKVPGYRAVFKRVGIGACFVACVGPDVVDRISHQIPAKKCTGDERPGLPKHCWGLDPAAVPTEILLQE